MRRSAVSVLALLVCGISACAPAGPAAPGPSAVGVPSPDPALPAGWRWESYGGVEVAVPGEWGWGNGMQRLTQWCADTSGAKEPIVGRPGAVTLVGCPGGRKPAPETLLANTGPVVSFARTTDPDGVRHEGDQTTVRLNGVLVTVNAPAGLRDRIASTARRVDVDSAGCPAAHPVSRKPQQRPVPPVDVTSLTAVSSVSACKFSIAGAGDSMEPRLVSSLRLDGTAADQAIRAIARTPPGGGPDHPEQCLPEASYGSDLIVLLVTSPAGRSEIVVRYSGCDHNAFDDGAVTRPLTAEALAPFIAGPNTVLEFSGSDKISIIRPSAG